MKRKLLALAVLAAAAVPALADVPTPNSATLNLSNQTAVDFWNLLNVTPRETFGGAQQKTWATSDNLLRVVCTQDARSRTYCTVTLEDSMGR